jgi:hypothetical protein
MSFGPPKKTRQLTSKPFAALLRHSNRTHFIGARIVQPTLMKLGFFLKKRGREKKMQGPEISLAPIARIRTLVLLFLHLCGSLDAELFRSLVIQPAASLEAIGLLKSLKGCAGLFSHKPIN